MKEKNFLPKSAWILLSVCFLSCAKEEANFDLSAFINKYLVCDRIKKGDGTVVVKGRDTGLDIMLDSARNYTIYSVPEQKYVYRVRKSRLYFYKKGTNPHLGDFMNIIDKSGKNLQLEYVDPVTDQHTQYYYTAD